MPLNKEGLKKKSTRRGTGFKFRDGDNIIRVLPPTKAYFSEDLDYIAHKVLVHYRLGPDGSPPVVCPKTAGETNRCPACETASRLRRNPATKEQGDDFGCRTRYFLNIMDMEKPKDGIQVCEVGPTIYRKILEVAVDPEYGDILDINEGRNFKITLTPANQSPTGYNSYSILPSPKQSSVKDVLPQGWANKLDELSLQVRDPMPAAEIAKLVNSALGKGDEDEFGTEPEHATKSAVDEFAGVSDEGDAVVKQGSDGDPGDDSSASEAEEDAPKERADGRPECFGNVKPASETCKACASKPECVDAMIGG